MNHDLDIIDQLQRWADELEARTAAPIVTTTFRRPIDLQHRRRVGIVVTVAAAALVLVLVLVGGGSARPPVDTSLPTTTAPSAADQPPLAGTTWSTQQDAATKVVFEIQRFHDGKGELVGVLGVGGITFCSTLDGTVTIDGTHITFDDLEADLGCDGAAAVLTSLASVTTWNYGTLDGEVYLRDAAARQMMRVRGCIEPECGAAGAEFDALSDPNRADVNLESASWQLDFRDSGLLSVVPYYNGYRGVSASLQFAAGQVITSAGLAGGCMSAATDYAVSDGILTIGTFAATPEGRPDGCGPSVRRLLDRLSGAHPFVITGNVLRLADLQFVARVVQG